MDFCSHTQWDKWDLVQDETKCLISHSTMPQVLKILQHISCLYCLTLVVPFELSVPNHQCMCMY